MLKKFVGRSIAGAAAAVVLTLSGMAVGATQAHAGVVQIVGPYSTLSQCNSFRNAAVNEGAQVLNGCRYTNIAAGGWGYYIDLYWP